MLLGALFSVLCALCIYKRFREPVSLLCSGRLDVSILLKRWLGRMSTCADWVDRTGFREKRVQPSHLVKLFLPLVLSGKFRRDLWGRASLIEPLSFSYPTTPDCGLAFFRCISSVAPLFWVVPAAFLPTFPVLRWVKLPRQPGLVTRASQNDRIGNGVRARSAVTAERRSLLVPTGATTRPRETGLVLGIRGRLWL